ncbi:MAG: EAL domain-containing protein [Kangiellaceae bacterium]|nr:EAL domain-containing protein [Kangiellaceae bacterium]
MLSRFIWVIITVVCFAALVNNSSIAHERSLNSLGIEDQLSQSVVTAITQDKYGFLWIGTEDGLNRFDGYQIKIFNTQNSHLSNNMIYDLLADDQGDVWVATYDGLSVFRQATGQFETFHHNPNEPFSLANDYVPSLAKDDQGGIWVATYAGPSYYDPTIGGFKTYPVMINRRVAATVNEVSQILVDKQQRVWLTNSRGELALFNQAGGRFELVQNVSSEKFGNIWDLKDAPDGNIWLASTDQGAIVYYPEQQRFEKIAALTFAMRHEYYKASSILFDEQGHLWLGTLKGGLYNLDLEKKSSTHYQYGAYGSIASNTINTIYQDNSGVIWVGTSSYLNKINPKQLKFDYLYKDLSDESAEYSLGFESTFALGITNKNHLWVGAEDGSISIYQLIKNNSPQKIAHMSSNEIDGTAIYGIKDIGAGRIMILTEQKVWLYDELKQQLDLWYSEPEKSSRIFLSSIYHKGSLWVATSTGLLAIDELGNAQEYKVMGIKPIEDNFINTLYLKQDKDELWLGTEHGVFRFNLIDKKYTQLSQLFDGVPSKAEESVVSVVFDALGRLWLGTYGNGAIIFDFTQQKVTELNSLVGGLNNTVYSMQADDAGALWIGTGKGLYRVEPKDFSLSHFSSSERQPINEFNSAVQEKSVDGRLLFGGVNGVIVFDPKDYQADSSAPQPVITDILINNKSIVVEQTSNSRLKASPHLAKKLLVMPDDSSFTFEFSALNLANAKNNRYRYMLEGHDKDWIEADSKLRLANYSNLSPATYQFKLLAANKDGIWSELPVTVEVEVQTASWLSPSAFALYGFILGLIILSFAYLAWMRAREKRFSAAQLAQSEERLKLSLWGSGDELWDWQIHSGALHLSNEWQYDFPRDGIRSGYSESNSNIHSNDLPYVKRALTAHLSGKSHHFESTYRISDEQGGWIWVLDRGKVVSRDANDKPLRMAGTIKNITELKSAEQQLNVIVKSFDNISDAVWILNDDFTYIAINKAFTRITGFTEEEVIGKTMKVNAVQQETGFYFDELRESLANRNSWHGELDAIRKNGQVYPIELNVDVVRDNDGNILNYVGVFSDITFRKKAEKELRRLATVDQLTGLRNRSSFRQYFAELIQNSDDNHQHALLFIDLDNFKRINDSLGHGVGDELLSSVAQILENLLQGSEGIVARLGGDEFTILLENVETWNQPAKIAQAILDRFTSPLMLLSAEVVVSPSIGIVMYPENGESAEELLKNADTAMYYAKKKGKNTYQFYTRQMNEQAKMRLSLENELRQAIEKDEFVVFYQPKVSLQTGKITSMEALVRWRNPNRGLVLPNEFIPLAEEVGFIIPISQKVIEKTCLQIRDWQNRGLFDGKVAVNLSAIQFYHENLWETVKNALHLAKIEADSLEFEITEGMVMEDLSHSIRQMKTLQDMGISLALDDFGVGYSSLGNLKDFPINTLKIDRSFIWDLEDSERDRNLVASIVTLAHNLDIKVVAEGVETVSQVEALKSMNCEEIQGFIFSKPVPPWEMEAMLSDPEINLNNVLLEFDGLEKS